jgi:hypothetical protein
LHYSYSHTNMQPVWVTKTDAIHITSSHNNSGYKST